MKATSFQKQVKKEILEVLKPLYPGYTILCTVYSLEEEGIPRYYADGRITKGNGWLVGEPIFFSASGEYTGKYNIKFRKEK